MKPSHLRKYNNTRNAQEVIISGKQTIVNCKRWLSVSKTRRKHIIKFIRMVEQEILFAKSRLGNVNNTLTKL